MAKPFTLITGASSGIGTKFAEAYAKKGHSLILVARSKPKMEKIAKRLSQHFGITAHVIKQDLSQEHSAETLYAACTKLGVEVNLLINNAGFGIISPFETQDITRVQEMLTLNVLTLTKLTSLFLPQIKKHKGGILNVSSLAAFQPMPYLAAYAATKAYVLLFSEALHAEVQSSGVRVLALCPGSTETRFMATANPQVKRGSYGIQTPGEVVDEAITALENWKSFTVPGKVNHLATLLYRFVPRSVALKLSKQVAKKRYKGLSTGEPMQ